MRKMQIEESGMSPLLIGVTGFVTFVVLLLGCLYTKRQLSKKAKKYAEATNASKSKERVEPEGASKEEKESSEIPPPGQWPIDEGGTVNPKPDSNIDPLAYCSHIPGEIRRTQQRIVLEEAEKAMDEEARKKEREIQRQQLAAIFNLMEKQKDKFGVDSMEDINEQMKLYSVSG